MALSALIGQLKRIGKMLNLWGAEFRATVGLSVILAFFFCLALADFLVRYSRGGRFAAWGFLLALAGLLVGVIMKTLSRSHTPEAVAANVEQAFPELDNHLINHLLFASAKIKDSLVAAYVKMEIPHWRTLNFKAMKDRRLLRRAQLALGVAALLLLLPLPFIGQAWTVAMVRVLNPFSDLTPVSLTRIVSVSPGDTVVMQGSDLTLSCKVEGKAGHEVLLDLRPADGEQKTYNLGVLKGSGEENFSYALLSVTTITKYRFRAGDAYVPDWKKIDLRPPLAFGALALKVLPPAYMNLPAKSYDAQSTAVDIPYGSRVSMTAECNTGLRSLALSGMGAPVTLTLDGTAKKGAFDLIVTNGAAFTLTAVDTFGDQAETILGFNLIWDRPPEIAIKYPQKPVLLAPGSAPMIDFSVSDDFGLGEITIEKIVATDDNSAPVEVLKSYKWVKNRGKEFTDLWRGENRKISDSGTLVLRVVARDNSAGGNVTVSPSLTFELDDVSELTKKRAEQAQKNAAGLTRIIELQRENIARSQQLQGVLLTTTPQQWQEAAEQQDTIRKVVKVLLETGGSRALGNLVPTIKKLYVNEMYEAISLLRSLPAVRDQGAKGRQAIAAITVQEKILRQLTAADKSAELARESQSTGSLIGVLDGLISGQSKIIGATALCVTQRVEVASSLIDDQDSLSSELLLFVKSCRAQALAGAGEDKGQSAFLESVASACEQQKISDDMLLAAEQLEENALPKALHYGGSALAKLEALRRQFELVQARDEREMREEMIEALQVVGAKLEKLKAVEKKLKEEMDKITENTNKNTEDFDVMQEEATEIAENIKEALLEIPRDLDIFTHLNVGNDLVEDVFSVFEEMEQKEEPTADDPEGGGVKEKAVAKREWYLEEMEKAEELIEDFEMWLGKDADKTKVTTEAFDKEEMPDGVALTPLQTKMEDIIGDLLELDKKLDEEADDGAINQALPDMEMGAEITEGDTTTFSAKGKSGNETPDHKEQDGRSNVGRQGMASGESAAGSGTIGEGDDNIEARRTQDPTQSGQVIADGEAQTKASGGGKMGSGKGDDWGDSGGTDRMDATEAGSWAQSLDGMAKKADEAYAQASLKGLRTDSLETAAHHIRQTADAVSKGAPITQVTELRLRAIGSLKKAKTELGEGAIANLDGDILTSTLTDVVEAGQEQSPEKYRELNADYYKKLSETIL
ncbi:MAG: hypothetical protein PHO37_09605 [Kiritimatiellae bacterium]|nr:hypothetical protein [Kiritimatiellia bacterium]